MYYRLDDLQTLWNKIYVFIEGPLEFTPNSPGGKQHFLQRNLRHSGEHPALRWIRTHLCHHREFSWAVTGTCGWSIRNISSPALGYKHQNYIHVIYFVWQTVRSLRRSFVISLPYLHKYIPYIYIIIIKYESLTKYMEVTLTLLLVVWPLGPLIFGKPWYNIRPLFNGWFYLICMISKY